LQWSGQFEDEVLVDPTTPVAEGGSTVYWNANIQITGQKAANLGYNFAPDATPTNYVVSNRDYWSDLSCYTSDWKFTTSN